MQTQSIWPFTKPQDLLGFCKSSCSAALWPRQSPPGFAALVDSVASQLTPFRQTLSSLQVRQALAMALPAAFWQSPLAFEWVDDVTRLVDAFCRDLGVRQCRVQLDLDRPCVRFHADNVNLRLVCTYRGQGTLWLEEDNIDLRAAEAKGTSNEEIVLRSQDVRQTGEWDVLVMKGKQSNATPLYHKSPPGGGGTSLVLKLDLDI
ncbi:DUF1826 domain-containing protein [bacterium]|nr:DUF1826 domain-containing protein [bacterium]